MISHSTLLRVGKILDDAFALFLYQHVIDGYEWLVQYYNPGDEVYFFGLFTLHDLDGRLHLTYWVSFRVLLWCIHCSSHCSNATQGTVLFTIFLTPYQSHTILIGHTGWSGHAG